MVYQLSSEEHKYLAGIRREKESFERLIKERGVRSRNFSFGCGCSWYFVVDVVAHHGGTDSRR